MSLLGWQKCTLARVVMAAHNSSFACSGTTSSSQKINLHSLYLTNGRSICVCFCSSNWQLFAVVWSKMNFVHCFENKTERWIWQVLQICGSHSMQIHLTWYNFNTWSDSFFFFNFWVIFYHCDRSLLYLTSFLDVTGLLSNDHMYISQTIPLTPPTRKSCQMDFKCNSIS